MKKRKKLNGSDIILVFDMDGTIVNLYGQANWLECLINEDVRPYQNAKPLYDMDELNQLLNAFKSKGVKIVITSWLSKDGSREYNKVVTRAKKEWLIRYQFPADEVHIVKFGSTKANSTRKYISCHQILIDDNEKVRKGWSLGSTIDASQDIIEPLRRLLAKIE